VAYEINYLSPDQSTISSPEPVDDKVYSGLDEMLSGLIRPIPECIFTQYHSTWVALNRMREQLGRAAFPEMWV
jgi:hypothetical protein